MDIWGVSNVCNTISEKTSAKAAQGIADSSFLCATAKALKEGKIVLEGQAGTANLNLMKNKFEIDEPFDFENAEEDVIKQFLSKIRRVLDEKNK